MSIRENNKNLTCKIVDVLKVVSRFSAGCSITLALVYWLFFPLLAIKSDIITIGEAFDLLGLVTGVSIILFIGSWVFGSTRIGNLATFITCALVIFVMWDPVDERYLNTVNLFVALRTISFSIIIIGGLLSLSNFILMFFTPRNRHDMRGAYIESLKK
ncbi:MAG: hypothetical protein ACTSWN_14510, partial [Promethearchaeota archaeon]